MVKDLNSVYRSHPAMWELDHVAEGFQWIDANDAAGNTFSFLRFGPRGADGVRPTIASITNFSGGPHNAYRLGLPHGGQWNEILNTDAESYGGSGVGNLGSVQAEALPWHGQPFSALLTVPPLGAVWLEPASISTVSEPDAGSLTTEPTVTEPTITATVATEPDGGTK
jgi:1,4-alpha-glucan branching enzyme